MNGESVGRLKNFVNPELGIDEGSGGRLEACGPWGRVGGSGRACWSPARVRGLRKRRAARPGPAWLRSGLASAVRRAGAPTNAQLDAEPEKAREELRLKKDT